MTQNCRYCEACAETCLSKTTPWIRAVGVIAIVAASSLVLVPPTSASTHIFLLKQARSLIDRGFGTQDARASYELCKEARLMLLADTSISYPEKLSSFAASELCISLAMARGNFTNEYGGACAYLKEGIMHIDEALSLGDLDQDMLLGMRDQAMAVGADLRC